MGFLRKVIDFVAHPSHSRTIGVLIFFILVATVSLTVYVAQQQQKLRQRAAGVCDQTITLCEPSVQRNSVCLNLGEQCRSGNDILRCQSE